MKKLLSGTITLIIGFLLLGLTLQCEDKQYIQYEKERFIYKDSLESMVDQLDNKIAQLRTHMNTLEDTSSVKNAIREDIADLEILHERFNQAVGVVDETEIGEWERTKTRVDNLMVEFKDQIEKVNDKYLLESQQ